jgi:uncharacterized protein YegL
MDLVCVLDVSGSMGGAKIRQVQDAVRFVIDQTQAKDRLGVVTFNHDAARALRLRKMDAVGKCDATQTTLRLMSGGGTCIAAGLDMALSMVEQRRQRNKVTGILLLTDGQDGSTRSRLPALVARARQAGCGLYAFGFGADHDAALLSEIAETSQTPFTFVEDTENIREAFAGAVGGLSSIVAQGLRLTLSCHATLKNIHTPFRVTRPSPTQAVVEIPDMFAGERRDFLVELSVPAVDNSAGQKVLVEASAQYTDLQTNCAALTRTSVMEITRVDEPQPEAEPDEEVAAQRERVEVTRALQEAATQSDQGQFDQAQSVLDSADRRLKSAKKKTQLCDALGQELQDARSRMKCRAEWESGGRAEVKDACQMHTMQRCTNTAVSKNSSVQKSGKSMYISSRQDAWIQASKASSS